MNIKSLSEKIEKRLAEEKFLRLKIAPTVNVPPDKVLAYYNKNKPRFKSPTKYRVSHIFTATVTIGPPPENSKDRTRAEQIVKRINQEALNKIQLARKSLSEGQDFHKICGIISEDEATRDKGGEMGELTLFETDQPLAEAISGLKPGEISQIVRSHFGYHILKLNGVTPEEQLPLNAVQSEILNHLLKKEVEVKRRDYVSALRKKARIEIFL